MGKYIIKGGNKLNGEVFISGAKNAVLPILASTVLNSGICILKNVPMLLDTFVAIDILKDLGCEVNYGENTVVVNSKNMYKTNVKEDLVKKMRSSIIFLGAIISRFKEASISYPGGCNLGKRPIDFHLSAFKELGIKIEDNQKLIKASVDTIKERIIDLPFASVGATQNIILASIFVKGKVVIKNCAKEPEIIDMVKFLRKMGANIYGEGTYTITVKGVEKLNNIVEYTIMPDRIEAGTFLCMSAITNGNVKINGITPNYVKSLTDILEQMGCNIVIDKDNIKIKNDKKLKCIEFLETKPYPYFPTDLQPQLMALLATADGESIIKENIFEARNKHIPELNKMGCNIIEDNSTFIIKGVNKLTGKNVFAKDLRGGASLITAGLFAKEKTVVEGADYINRGYEHLDKKLNILGADIKHIKD
ncbi:UDP-N-acetylglucosamine 1-carboxyvinyltransferase [uncultured Tyzzerella sp.]|uniref:UDP-N-acetylglucosamine 1-carboxyvinyltransferase n=1 Tax=uncultured Tyzzerella sp. TaxID=2321398 RepID=UPI0029422561|nr:UDP-N-acetylglucosamine 1-carboxyvinyltransferase [uncultured Tyzzerella sp.]